MSTLITITKKKSRRYYNNHAYRANTIGFNPYRVRKRPIQDAYTEISSSKSVSKEIFSISRLSKMCSYYDNKLRRNNRNNIRYYTTYVYSLGALKRMINNKNSNSGSKNQRLQKLKRNLRILNL